MVSTEAAELAAAIAVGVWVLGLATLLFIHALTRSAKQRDEAWARREQEQARTKGTVGIEPLVDDDRALIELSSWLDWVEADLRYVLASGRVISGRDILTLYGFEDPTGGEES